MAIQNRRGDYNNFDPTKQVAGEFAVVLTNDPNTDDGKAVYITYSAGNVKRLATYQEIAGLAEQAKTSADNAEESEENAKTSADNAEESEENAETSATNASNSEASALEYKNYVQGAVEALPPILSIDFETGELLADGGLLLLSINQGTGNLEYLMAGGN
jgi:hypothetical protein